HAPFEPLWLGDILGVSTPAPRWGCQVRSSSALTRVLDRPVDRIKRPGEPPQCARHRRRYPVREGLRVSYVCCCALTGTSLRGGWACPRTRSSRRKQPTTPPSARCVPGSGAP